MHSEGNEKGEYYEKHQPHAGVDDLLHWLLMAAGAAISQIGVLAVTLAAGLLAMPMMRYVGMGMLRLHAAIPLQQMVMGVIVFVVALVWLSTGFVGIGVLIVGTIIGLLPPRIGIRRSHGMGIILVPIMIYTFAQKFDSFGFI